MNPALLSLGAAATAFALVLVLGRRLISPLRSAQIIGGAGSGLVMVLAAIRLLEGSGHG